MANGLMFAQTRMHIVYEDVCVFVWVSISILALLHIAFSRSSTASACDGSSDNGADRG